MTEGTDRTIATREILKASNCCVVMPTYNNAGTVVSVLQAVMEQCDDVIVVNDGCTDNTSELLKPFEDQIDVVLHPENKGKGVSLRDGLSHAREKGYKYAITIDSDGQHYPEDMSVFAAELEAGAKGLLVGARNLQADGMPSKNTFANKFSNFWYRLETGIRLSDTQSGYRLYPLDDIRLDSRLFTSGYEFELEILVFSAWRGVEVRNVPVRVYYPPEGERVSHFKPFRDFTRISILNTVLVLYCLFWQWPKSFFKSLTKENVRRFIDENIIHSKESNFRISASVALGVCMGILPIWGYQMVAAFALAVLLRLNKIIALVASNISIPPMIPFILFGSYWLGCRICGSPMLFSFSEFSLANAGRVMLQYVLGSCVLAVLAALVAGLCTYLLLLAFRKTDR